MKPTELEDCPYTFAPPRASRWLQRAIKNQLVSIEEVKIQIVMAVHKDHPNFVKDLELGICNVSASFAKFIEELEILSLATKIMPEWMKNSPRHHECAEKVTGKNPFFRQSNNYYYSKTWMHPGHHQKWICQKM